MLLALGIISLLPAAVRGVTNMLSTVRSFGDYATEAQQRERTGAARRRVRSDKLFITDEEYAELHKNPIWVRARWGYERLVKEGEVAMCPACDPPHTS